MDILPLQKLICAHVSLESVNEFDLKKKVAMGKGWFPLYTYTIKAVLMTNGNLMKVESICRMLQEHSAILLTSILL